MLYLLSWGLINLFTFIVVGVAWTVVSVLVGYWVAPMMSDRTCKVDDDDTPRSGPEFNENRKMAVIALRAVARQMRER